MIEYDPWGNVPSSLAAAFRSAHPESWSVLIKPTLEHIDKKRVSLMLKCIFGEIGPPAIVFRRSGFLIRSIPPHICFFSWIAVSLPRRVFGGFGHGVLM
jgi:hypothetical protein